MCQIASVSTFSSSSVLAAGADSSDVAASSFFMIENMKAAEMRQMTMSIPQIAATDIFPQRSMGMDTR